MQEEKEGAAERAKETKERGGGCGIRKRGENIRGYVRRKKGRGMAKVREIKTEEHIWG